MADIVDPGQVQYDAEELDFLRKVYAIVGRLSDQAHLANFHMTLDHAERREVFHEMVGAMRGSQILPGFFIGTHALAVCADSIAGFNGGYGDKKLKQFLFNQVETHLGKHVLDNLESWLNGAKQAKEHVNIKGDTWFKLGALTTSIDGIDTVIATLPYAKTPESKQYTGHSVRGFNYVAYEVKGEFPALDALYAGKTKSAKAQMTDPHYADPFEVSPITP